MSEKMYPIPFKSLMNWIVTEYARECSATRFLRNSDRIIEKK